MSQPRGNFDCAELQTIVVSMDERWSDAQANRADIEANVETVKILRSQQTATMPELEGQQDKDQKVKIYWLADCGEDEEVECTDRCELGGPAVEADCKEYEVTRCIKRGFSIPENMFRKSKLSRDQVVAYQMMRKMKMGVEQLNREVITAVNALKGVNQLEVFPGDVDGSTTFISAANWDMNLLGYLEEVADENYMKNSFLLNGRNLRQKAWQIKHEAPNAQEGQANVNKLSTIPMFWDNKLDGVLDDPITMLISKSAYAFVNTFRYSSTPINIGTKQFWSIPDKNVPGLTWDVGYEVICEDDDFIHNWSMWLTWDFFGNPLPCNTENTGVLEFMCGEAA